MVRFLHFTLMASALLLVGCGSHSLSTPSPLAASTEGRVSARGVDGFLPPNASLSAISLPIMSVTAQGRAAEPINILIAGSEEQVANELLAAGWLPADAITAVSVAKTIRSFLSGKVYPTAPISPLYFMGRAQQWGFQKNPVGIHVRDHLRVWPTPLHDRQGRRFWAIGCSKDIGVKRLPGKPMPTHRIDGELDAERELVVSDLTAGGRVALRYQLRILPEAYKGVNGGEDPYVTDGRVEILEMGSGVAPTPAPKPKEFGPQNPPDAPSGALPAPSPAPVS